MIPKIIHYCWFGHNEMPQSSINFINGWGKKCPDYKIIKWSEKNFNVNHHLFTKIAYRQHNWAFVSDYVRLYALKRMGGVYLDTDVQVIRSLDPLLHNNSFIGLQEWDAINSGLIYGTRPDDKNINNILKIYDNMSLRTLKHLSPITNNTVSIITSYFRKLGFKYKNTIQHVNGCTIYPTDYFSPEAFGSKDINITNNTYTIHHYFGSWTRGHLTDERRKHINEGRILRKVFGRYLFIHCYNIYYKLKTKLHGDE